MAKYKVTMRLEAIYEVETDAEKWEVESDALDYWEDLDPVVNIEKVED